MSEEQAPREWLKEAVVLLHRINLSIRSNPKDTAVALPYVVPELRKFLAELGQAFAHDEDGNE